MLCKKPYMRGVSAFGCGQCLPCRLNRRRLWTHRLLLESFAHTFTSFVTLTYSDESLPENATLVPGDVQKWLKRLRKLKKVRYYLVGEYGEKSHRPHYHVALFGHPGCLHYPLAEQKAERRKCLCPPCVTIRETWDKGHTDNNHLTLDSAQYVCGYVTKSMTHKEEKCGPRCKHPPLNGRHPEFARQSLRPGIGALVTDQLVEFICSEDGANDLINTGDVPSVLRHGKKILPLGRYLRRKLREKYGFENVGSPQEVLRKLDEEMSRVLEEALEKPENRSKPFGQILQEKCKQKILSLEARQKIFSQKGVL